MKIKSLFQPLTVSSFMLSLACCSYTNNNTTTISTPAKQAEMKSVNTDLAPASMVNKTINVQVTGTASATETTWSFQEPINVNIGNGTVWKTDKNSEYSYKRTSSTTAIIEYITPDIGDYHYGYFIINMNFTTPNSGTLTGKCDNIGLGWGRGDFYGTFQIN